MFYHAVLSPYEDKLMGNYADAIAEKYGFTREQQDAFATESVRRALAASDGGCRPQKLSERPQVPRNTHGVTHRESTWRARPCLRAGEDEKSTQHPGRDFNRQNSFQPARCQRIRVSGRTTTRLSRQSNNRDSKASAIRVAESIRRGFTPRSM